jgi:hypothetical protein
VAADLICDHGLRATHPESPAMFLYYHAIELAAIMAKLDYPGLDLVVK